MSNHQDISEANKNVWMMKTASMFSFPHLCLRVSESDNEPTMEAFLLMERGAGAGCGKLLLGSWLEKRGHCPLLGGQGTWRGQSEATGDLCTDIAQQVGSREAHRSSGSCRLCGKEGLRLNSRYLFCPMKPCRPGTHHTLLSRSSKLQLSSWGRLWFSEMYQTKHQSKSNCSLNFGSVTRVCFRESHEPLMTKSVVYWSIMLSRVSMLSVWFLLML